MIFEVVLETLDELKAVESYPVKRVELCAALEVGGLTPSLRLAEAVVQNSSKEIHVMLRARAGDFDYSDREIDVMINDLEDFSRVGAKGVVFGFLSDKNVNINASRRLIERANLFGLETTFHRALDGCTDYLVSLERVIELGCTRILTSGGFANVSEGKEALVNLEKSVGSRIQVMPGGGVTPELARYFYENNLNHLHFNIKKPIEVGNETTFGNKYTIDVEKLAEICKLT